MSVLFGMSDKHIFLNKSQFTCVLLVMELGLICYMDSWVTHNTFWEQNNQNKQI